MPVRASTRRRALLWVGGLTLLGLAHALVVAPRYHFGSFDDDASYVLVAKALAAGELSKRCALSNERSNDSRW